MALVEVKDLEKAFSGRSILRGITFDLQKGERIGLVGANGSGKTTLLKILAGTEEADRGTVRVARSCKVGYVSQIPRLDPDETVKHQVSLVFEEVHELERKMHAAAEDLAKHTDGPQHDDAMERYSRLETEFQHMQGWDIARRVEAVLHELGFSESDLEKPIKMLSGGQKSRAQLARLLLEAPDLMLLDEPTNHLDLPMLDWLEETINEMGDTAMVVVSHDRYFLDSVVDEIFDMVDGQIEQFPGNYSAFTELKAERQLAQQRRFDQQQAYIAKQEEYIRRFGAGQRARQARGRKTRLERLKSESLVSKVRRDGKKAIVDLEVQKPSGHDVLKIEDLSKSYPGKPLFSHLSLTVSRGKRIGIIGPNGSGKTTLLDILANEQQADSGKIKWGHGVQVQYFRQEHQTLNLQNDILEELQSAKIKATRQELHDLAGLLLFSGDTVEKKVGVLSGGERSRVALGKILLNPANLIFFDEPTNHLDMPTCEVLEEALDSYDGTLMLVSHDRYFLDQVVEQVLVLNPPHLPGVPFKLYNGGYTAYVESVAKEKAELARQKSDQAAREREEQQRTAEEARKRAEREKQKAASAKSAASKSNAKFTRMSVEEIEKNIAKLEDELAHLETSFSNPKVTANPSAMKELQAKYNTAKTSLAEFMAAWEAKSENP